LFSFSLYYNIQMWLYGPIGLDLCFFQPPTFEDFYGYLGQTVLEISFRTISFSCDSSTMLVCFCKASFSHCRKATGVSKGPYYTAMSWE
jgi:hypothetical protein